MKRQLVIFVYDPCIKIFQLGCACFSAEGWKLPLSSVSAHDETGWTDRQVAGEVSRSMARQKSGLVTDMMIRSDWQRRRQTDRKADRSIVPLWKLIPGDIRLWFSTWRLRPQTGYWLIILLQCLMPLAGLFSPGVLCTDQRWLEVD